MQMIHLMEDRKPLTKYPRQFCRMVEKNMFRRQNCNLRQMSMLHQMSSRTRWHLAYEQSP